VTSIVFRDRRFSHFIIIFFIFCATRIQIYFVNNKKKNIVTFLFFSCRANSSFPSFDFIFFHGFNHQLYLSGWSSPQKERKRRKTQWKPKKEVLPFIWTRRHKKNDEEGDGNNNPTDRRHKKKNCGSQRKYIFFLKKKACECNVIEKEGE
jgi:hypothetical protein